MSKIGYFVCLFVWNSFYFIFLDPFSVLISFCFINDLLVSEFYPCLPIRYVAHPLRPSYRFVLYKCLSGWKWIFSYYECKCARRNFASFFFIFHFVFETRKPFPDNRIAYFMFAYTIVPSVECDGNGHEFYIHNNRGKMWTRFAPRVSDARKASA